MITHTARVHITEGYIALKVQVYFCCFWLQPKEKTTHLSQQIQPHTCYCIQYKHVQYACTATYNTQYSELSTNLSKLELVQRSLLVEVVLLDLAQDLLPGGGTAGNSTSHVVLVSSITESYNS